MFDKWLYLSYFFMYSLKNYKGGQLLMPQVRPASPLAEVLPPETYKSPTAYQRLMTAIEACRNQSMPWRKGEPLTIADALKIPNRDLMAYGIGKTSLDRLNSALTNFRRKPCAQEAELNEVCTS